MRGAAVARGGAGRGLAVTRGGVGRAPLSPPAGLHPLLAEAVLLLRASEFTGSTGDDWVNEGTGSATLNAQCNNTVDGIAAGTPVFSASPIPGFQFADGSSGDASSGPFYSVPHSTLLDPGTGSFTVFAWVTVQYDGTGVFGNICSKIDTTGGTMSSGGIGWQLVNSSFIGGAGVLVSNGASSGSIPVGINLAASGAVMTQAAHLLVARVDVTGNMHVFLDGTKSSGADATQLGTIAATHPLIFGRGDANNIGHAYGYWGRALTDAEIQTTLPAALGV